MILSLSIISFFHSVIGFLAFSLLGYLAAWLHHDLTFLLCCSLQSADIPTKGFLYGSISFWWNAREDFKLLSQRSYLAIMMRGMVVGGVVIDEMQSDWVKKFIPERFSFPVYLLVFWLNTRGELKSRQRRDLLTVVLHGATGPIASSINGMYTPTKEMVNGKPVFEDLRNKGRCLFMATDGRWRATTVRDKNLNECKNFAPGAFSEEGLAHPTLVREWFSDDGEESARMVSLKATLMVILDISKTYKQYARSLSTDVL